MAGQPESIGKVIHNKKEPKKKQKAKGLSAIGLKDYRTIGENSTSDDNSQMPITPGAGEQSDNSNEAASRTRNQIKNIEIDEWLFTGIQEDLIDPKYMSYYAKACHTLGLAHVNQLRIQALNGKTPQKLFAYKVKGAMSLHFKRQYYKDSGHGYGSSSVS